jgi:basic membrane protein A
MKTASCLAAAAALVLAASACKKADSAPGPAPAPQGAPGALKVGLVTDVGGRGDQSFNDGALRGLEMWAGGKRYAAKGYRSLSAAELQESIPDDIRRSVAIRPLGAEPVVLQAKQQEDYAPNLQVLVDEGVRLAIGVGFMLENAVEATARKNPAARFLLIDSPSSMRRGLPSRFPTCAPWPSASTRRPSWWARWQGWSRKDRRRAAWSLGPLGARSCAGWQRLRALDFGPRTPGKA